MSHEIIQLDGKIRMLAVCDVLQPEIERIAYQIGQQSVFLIDVNILAHEIHYGHIQVSCEMLKMVDQAQAERMDYMLFTFYVNPDLIASMERDGSKLSNRSDNYYN